MATDNTLSTMDSLMKELYPSDKVLNLASMDHPFLQLVPKFEKVGGSSYDIGFLDGANSAVHTASTSITNSGVLYNEKFQVTLSNVYGVGSFDRRLVKQSLFNGNLIDVIKDTVDDKIMAVKDAVNSQLIAGDGTGILGQLSAGSDVTSATITLADIETVVRFRQGDVLKNYSDSTTARAGSNVVVAINYDTGTLTTTTSWETGVTSPAAGDYLVKEGDGATVPQGLAGWLPTSAPAATAFYGVDRSVNSHRYGTIVDGTGMALQEAFNKALAKITRNGGRPDCILLPPAQWNKFSDEIQAQVQFVNPDGKAKPGFSFFTIFGPAGPCKVVTERFMDADLAYILTMNTWKLVSAGKVPELQDDFGGRYLRDASADAFEFRVSAYYGLGCRAPCHNGVLSLDAAYLNS